MSASIEPLAETVTGSVPILAPAADLGIGTDTAPVGSGRSPPTPRPGS